MNITTNYKEVVERLTEIPQFKNNFPHLIQELSKGNLYVWDSDGTTHELSEEHIKDIEEIENKAKEYNYIVYAVLDNYFIFDGIAETVHMVTYLVLTSEPDDIRRYGHYDNRYFAFAAVENKTWSLTEYGDVVIAWTRFGGPKRLN